MTALIGSPFLQALGWAIAGSLWQMALLWVVYQISFLAWKNARASARTATATALLFTGFIWFISSLVRHYWAFKTATPSEGAAFPTNAAYAFAPFILHGHALLDYVNATLLWAEPYLPYLSSAYLLMLAFLLVRVGKAYRHVQVVRSTGLTRIDGHWRVYVQEMAYRIGIHKKIGIWLSDRIDIPATVGYLKPLILLPITSFNQLTTEQVEAILLHELAHIRRHDYLLNLVITVVDTILFFNPFAQLITRHIRTERENSCDDFVLQFRYNPHTYASALLSLEKQRFSPELAMAASGKTDLLDRIRRILNVPSKPMNYGQKLMALLITAGILSSLAWLTPDHVGHKPLLSREASVENSTSFLTLPIADAPAPREKNHARTSARQEKAKLEGTAIPIIVPDAPPCADGYLAQLSIEWGKKAGRSDDWGKGVVAIADSCRVTILDTLTDAIRDLNEEAEGKVTADSEIALVRINDLLARKALAFANLKIRQNFALTQQQMLLDVRKATLQLQLRQEESKTRCLQTERRQEEQRVLKLKALRAMVKAKAQVLEQQPDDADAGIVADQPGWQPPAAPAKAFTHWKVVPTGYLAYSPAKNLNYCKVADASAFQAYTVAAFNNYKERVTFYKKARQEETVSSVYTFMTKLEEDGMLPEGTNVRIMRNSKTLTVNGKPLSEADCARYQHYMDGKSLIIISTGKILQVTVK